MEEREILCRIIFSPRSIRNLFGLADLADIHQPRPAKSYGQRAK